jgi:plastocyanin
LNEGAPFVIRHQRLLLAAALAATPTAALAEDHRIHISHLEFDPPAVVEASVGDRLVFENRSEITHNLYVTDKDGRMTYLDTQVPGVTRIATLTQSGPTQVRCWIHPIIRMDLDVKPAAD